MDWILNNDEMNNKSKEIQAMITNSFEFDNIEEIKKALNKYELLTLTAPLEQAPVMQRISIHSLGRDGGVSRRPGHIIFNLRNLTEVFTDSALTIGGVISGNKFLLGCAVLKVGVTIISKSEIKIDELHATSLASMWLNKGPNNKIDEVVGFNETNNLLINHSRNTISNQDFDNILTDLIKIGCIEKENNIIHLKERITLRY
ncbi:hypothetical protein BSK59_28740 [Paenibacillus odorifer]|uniref:hypothetical protein n=1 Tax=Paenibacillus odorifer TaxID=189426 RepID=UPI00096EC1D7|nr:hypothetical protein [Paenibacillus odorifer]OME46835.1 hypothetical protein BSK59_28740 [Paenibacillus odorifer]